MNKFLSLCALTLLILVSPFSAAASTHSGYTTPVFESDQAQIERPYDFAASNCAETANSIASSYGNAQILSVEKSGNSCVIVIRVEGSNGNPPRIIRKTVSG